MVDNKIKMRKKNRKRNSAFLHIGTISSKASKVVYPLMNVRHINIYDAIIVIMIVIVLRN